MIEGVVSPLCLRIKLFCTSCDTGTLLDKLKTDLLRISGEHTAWDSSIHPDHRGCRSVSQ
jgi:hypothetical protein